MNAQAQALAADELSRRAFRAWQAEREPTRRDALKAEYEASQAKAERLWEVVGPDPMLSMVKSELDRAAARASDPNPDDPDDEEVA